MKKCGENRRDGFLILSFSLICRINNLDLTVNVSNSINCYLGKKPRTVNVEKAEVESPQFKSFGNIIQFEVPAQLMNGVH